jgi:hypothetical protein
VRGTLCLAHCCTVHTVQLDDTCASIAAVHSASEVQLRTWNPATNASCSNLGRAVSEQLCVSNPGALPAAWVSTAATALAATLLAGTAVAAPTNTAPNTKRHCARYHRVAAGEYCNLIVLKYALPLADFVFLNPDISANCTNLFLHQSYCMQPVSCSRHRDTLQSLPPLLLPFSSLPSATKHLFMSMSFPS